MNSSIGGGPGGIEPVTPPLRLKRQRTRFTDISVTIVLPWLVFFLVVSLFLFAFHDLRALVWGLLAACLALALFFLALGCFSRNGTFLAVGYLCLTSLVVGSAVGLWLDREYLQKYWELDNGVEYKDVDPTDARTADDAGIIHFMAGTFVDDKRTIGFVADGGIYCVAPVALQSRFNATVSYWAVGEDCCQMRSNFDCGMARELDAVTAVMERPTKAYSKAIQEAASVYGLDAPTNSSKLVSFVNDPKVVIGDIWDEALTIALISMIMDLCMCAVAGLVLAKILIKPPSEQQQHFLKPDC